MTIGCSLAVRLLQAVCLMCTSTSLVANAKDIRSIIVATDLPQYSGRTDTVSLPRGMDPEFEVRDSWAVGAAQGRFTITDRLHSSTENDSAMSETAQFTVYCTP
jgi:hypothetical protein